MVDVKRENAEPYILQDQTAAGLILKEFLLLHQRHLHKRSGHFPGIIIIKSLPGSVGPLVTEQIPVLLILLLIQVPMWFHTGTCIQGSMKYAFLYYIKVVVKPVNATWH